MVAGLFTMGAGAFLFIPAASVPAFALFLSALIVLAAGMTILQVSANPYVAVLGTGKNRIEPVEFGAGVQFVGNDDRSVAWADC